MRTTRKRGRVVAVRADPPPLSGAQRQAWLAALGDSRSVVQISPTSGVTRVTASWIIKPRALTDHLFYFLDAGGCSGCIADAAVELRAGDLLWLQPGTAHEFRQNPGQRPRILHVRVMPGCPSVAHQPPLVLRDAWTLRPLLYELLNESLVPAIHAAHRSERLRALLASLAIGAWRLADHQQGPGLSPERLRRLLQFVRTDARRRRTIVQCAQELGLSHLHFTRLVRATFGVPPRTWLLHERMRAAAIRLQETALPVAAVALEFGYLDPHLFSRQFRDVIGCPPTAVR
jgi:AraC-like DNA-binding protein